MGFEFERLQLEDSYCITNYYSGDTRGGFLKSFERTIYREGGVEFEVQESFLSISQKSVIRGLHFQTRNPQAKLVCVPKGRVWDVIVDLRPKSKTYKKWIGIELSEDNHKALFIPRGFAHGFLSLEDDTIMLYHCDGEYDKETDTGIRYNDPEIGIVWPLTEKEVIHSDRDLRLPSFSEYLLNPMDI